MGNIDTSPEHSDLRNLRAGKLSERLSVILEATAALNDMLTEPKRLYAGLLEHLHRAVPFNSGSLQVLEENSSRIIAFRGDLDPEVVMGLRFLMDPMFPNYVVVSTRKPVAYADIRESYPHFWTRKDEFNSGNIRSWLGVPMVVSDSVIGMIALDRNRVDPFDDDEIRIVQGIADHAAVAIRNARTYAELQEALAAKDALMREMHHRVKNNLQLVSSLIDIHADHVVEERTRLSLSELQVRIGTIASIHERLYSHADLDSVRVDEYLGELAADVLQSFQRSTSRVRLELDLHPVTVELSMAVPLGLIASELIMNTLKYAFSGDSEGLIRVGLSSRESEAVLVIEDTGIGIGDTAKSGEGFGFLLVRNLAKQLHGDAEIDSEPGHTVWRIRFSLRF